MRRSVFYLGILFLLIVCSCKNENNTTIGFLIHSLTSSRWQMDISFIQERAEELGARVELRNADGDENVQLKQAHELLEAGVDVLIVVAANQNTAAAIVRDAHDFGVPVIGYDRTIKNSDLDYLISFEYERIGELMVEYATQQKPSGNYILLWGDPSDANARFVKTGQERALEPILAKGQISIVYKTFIEGWSRTNANKMMSEILDFYPGKIDAVISSNDPMALGAFDALVEHGYKPFEVEITGQDATLEACRSIVAGGMTMSVFKNIKELAYTAVDLAVDVTGKKKMIFERTINNGRKDVPALLLKPGIVDRANLDEAIIAAGVFTREAVYE
ncbi:MAG TPA: substrate-binding domain-containing protein [Prolixibacteraceae bacterium]|nr:substrate-binding domain-containing protein [Prolixibacteraceae bacterium]